MTLVGRRHLRNLLLPMWIIINRVAIPVEKYPMLQTSRFPKTLPAVVYHSKLDKARPKQDWKEDSVENTKIRRAFFTPHPMGVTESSMTLYSSPGITHIPSTLSSAPLFQPGSCLSFPLPSADGAYPCAR